jgi:hypothetical protein
MIVAMRLPSSWNPVINMEMKIRITDRTKKLIAATPLRNYSLDSGMSEQN